MKKLVLLLTLTAFQQGLFAQGVGINTTSPDPSAALDIQSTNKGILIPKVELKDLTDKTTIANPANALMVFNTNAALKYGIGYYYNGGTAASPDWKAVSDIPMPYNYGGSSTKPLFQIDNYNNTNVGLIAIKGYGAGNNTGVYAKSDSRFALEADGRIKIFGNGQNPGQGKVLTSNGSGEATWQGAVGFSATGVQGGGPESVPSNTHYTVPFSSVRYNLDGNYSLANSKFTASVDGIYHFDSQLTLSTGAYNAELNLVKERNGELTSLARNLNRKEGFTTSLTFSCEVELQQGDLIYLTIRHDYSGSILLGQPTNESFFNGRLVIKL
ncbi:complement C1q domain-containing protein [Dyadobacter sp. CY323]|uniref:complement C1q domain-containing protein n=1 Tax=Dyadobacter sp. CY323 TaxID=2907302 RepID=UPI001F371865|nr:complement C1q domain-containing protein [Dyadobacter sp. CY323]MCE6987822.1 complement C1q domain-containing protein [Dyadobacter sp. CY323]